MRSILWWFCGTVLLPIPVAYVGCSDATGHSDPSGSTGVVAGASGGGAGGGSFASSECGECIASACADEIEECGFGPSCAAFLGCLAACPVGPSGDADVDCEEGCPDVSGTTDQAAQRDLNACRTEAAQGECPACNEVAAGGASGNGGRGGAGAVGGARGGAGGAESPAENPLIHQECAPSSETNACYKCEDEYCCETYAACRIDSPECSAFTDCMQDSCPPTADYWDCWLACDALHPEGTQLFAERLTCIMLYCADETACGDAPLDPCLECQNLECTNEYVNCDVDYDCRRLEECSFACGIDTECQDACFVTYASGLSLWESLSTCLSLRCSLECG